MANNADYDERNGQNARNEKALTPEVIGSSIKHGKPAP